MTKFNLIELEPWLTIGVSYEYEEWRRSMDIDLADDPPFVEIGDISIHKGSIMELLYYVDGLGSDGFSEWLEAKLYELND